MSITPNPSADATALPAHDYHLVVGPALKVMANLAASRGDPVLYNDMASMLVLMQMVRALGEHHQAGGGAQAEESAFQQAPLGACAMVLNDADLAEAQKQDCLWALEAAQKHLQAEGVLGDDQDQFQGAYTRLAQGQRGDAERLLEETAKRLVSAIDEWERNRA